MTFLYKKTSGATSLKKGFTLVELLVVITIFVMVTALVLVKYQNFNSGVILNGLAYNVALTIREAQSYGINIAKNTSVTVDPTEGCTDCANYDHAYGTHFDQTSPLQFTMFVDANDDNRYQTSEQIKTYLLKNGNKILPTSGLCAGNDSNSCISVNNLDILFKRPSPAAIITPSKNNYGRIILTSIDGRTKSVVVQRTGQISVEN